LQGVTSNQDYVYMSASFGNHNSLIVRYERHGDSLDQPIYVVLPPYLEQISFDGNNLYAIFESATPKYRRRAKVVVDRLLVMTPTEFEQYAKPYKQSCRLANSLRNLLIKVEE
jgi:hypothetical protein